MRIGILGNGAMAAALGGAWTRAGHEVFVGGRDSDGAARVASAIGAAGGGGSAEAARFGDAVLVAVPAEAAPEVVGSVAAHLAGRIVLDCTVPMVPGPAGPVLTTSGGPDSMASRLAAVAPEAKVAKVFGLCHESIWTLPSPKFEEAPLAVPFCTDDPAAAERVTVLIESMGCTAMPCGGLDRATLLEATALFAIGVWWSGGQARHAFPAPALAPGAIDD